MSKQAGEVALVEVLSKHTCLKYQDLKLVVEVAKRISDNSK